VVPLFLEQIKAGGPVTVTHPEMRRYFMLIPEAVQLVLQAATLAEGGEIFVLEMGEQIKVLDMATNLIRLSGFVPHDEIPIKFVGIRPGEKMIEELVGGDETIHATPVEHILKVRPRRSIDGVTLNAQIETLELTAMEGRSADTILGLTEIVPEYKHSRQSG